MQKKWTFKLENDPKIKIHVIKIWNENKHNYTVIHENIYEGGYHKVETYTKKHFEKEFGINLIEIQHNKQKTRNFEIQSRKIMRTIIISTILFCLICSYLSINPNIAMIGAFCTMIISGYIHYKIIKKNELHRNI